MIFKTILFRVKSIGNKRHNNNYGWFFIVEWLCRRGAAGAGQFKSIISGSLSTHTALIMRTFSNFTKTCHLNQTKENWLWFISSCFVSQLCRCRKQQQLRCRPVGARGIGGAQIMTDQLALSQLGGTDYVHHINIYWPPPPVFQTYRRPCDVHDDKLIIKKFFDLDHLLGKYVSSAIGSTAIRSIRSVWTRYVLRPLSTH